MPIPRLVNQSYQDYYDLRFRRYGNSWQYGGWENKEDQILTYIEVRELMGIDNWKLAYTILDVGCGVGHFFEHLLKASAAQNAPFRKFQFLYTGIDGNLKASQAATLAYGERFLHQDLSTYWPSRQFDYVVCLGLLGFDEDIVGKLKKMIKLCRGHLIFSLVLGKHDGLCAIDYSKQTEIIEQILGVNSLRVTRNSIIWSAKVNE
jgi:SAM-dependent methyltransferase